MPPRKRYAIKGEHHFHNINDAKLNEYMDMIQALMFEFDERTDKEVHDSLYKVFRLMELEILDRDSCKPEKDGITKVSLNKRLRSPAIKNR